MDAFPGAGEDRSLGALQLLTMPTTKGQRGVNKDAGGPLFGLKSTSHWGGEAWRTARTHC